MDKLERLNKVMAHRGLATRRGADALIAAGQVLVNGKRAEIGQRVDERDEIEVRSAQKSYRYYAYNKPRGVVTHSPRRGEKDIAAVSGLRGFFPIGRLDKDSHGLIILTDDGRITERLLNPKFDHEKEYIVTTVQKLRPSFAGHMSRGVDIDGYKTKPCTVRVIGDTLFSITISEGKKHQIRRMCAAMHVDVSDLKRVRIMNIELKNIAPGAYREIHGEELYQFLKSLNISDARSRT